jgi:hypothetical protein
MEIVYLNDRWPFRVQTYEPDGTPLTVDDARVTITRLEDMVVVLPTISVAPGGIFSGYVEYIVSPPITSVEGNYIIDWDIVLNGVTKSFRQFFQVIVVPDYTMKEMTLINALRVRLKDNRPELYRVDEAEEKWHDEELYSFLYYGLADFNGYPPFWTDYTFETLPAQVHGMVLLGAQITSLIAEATLQAANDFSYNDNGLTVTLSRSGKYMAIAGQLWNMYGQLTARVKRFLGFYLTEWVGVKTERMPYSVRRPLSMLPHLENVFGREGGT